MEAYLGRCLESLLIPKLDALEVIVVNDGSHDRTSEIAHEFADKYPGTYRVIDKPNGNYGSCINAALPTVTARYVRLLDADDYYDTCALRDFVDTLQIIDADAVFTGYRVVDNYGNEGKSLYASLLPYNVPHDFSVVDIQLQNYDIQMHALTFKTEVFKRFNYVQTEGVSYSDSEWVIYPLSYCNSVIFLELLVYNYVKGRNGQTVSKQMLRKHYADIIKVGHDSIDFIVHNNILNQEFAEKQLALKHIYAFIIALLNRDKTSLKLFNDHDKYVASKSQTIYTSSDSHTLLRFYRMMGSPTGSLFSWMGTAWIHMDNLLKKVCQMTYNL